MTHILSLQAGWTDERVDRLKALWEAGQSGKEIARLLGGGLTREAVIGKVHRLKLAKRVKETKASAPKVRSTGVRGAAAVKQAKARSEASRSVPLEQRAPPRFTASATRIYAVAPSLPLPQGAQEAPGLCRSLTDLGPHMCKWPIGDPQEAAFSFCGRKTDRLYCEAHAYRSVDHAATARVRKTRDMARTLRRYA